MPYLYSQTVHVNVFNLSGEIKFKSYNTEIQYVSNMKESYDEQLQTINEEINKREISAMDSFYKVNYKRLGSIKRRKITQAEYILYYE